MRIVFMTDKFFPYQTTVGKIVFHDAEKLLDRGHSVFIITTVQDEAQEGWFEYEGLRVFRIYSRYHEKWRAYLSLYNPQTSGKIKKILKDINPDVVHAHNIHYRLSYYALKLAKKSGAKVFLTAHDVMSFHYGKLVECINVENPSCDIMNYRVSWWQQLKRYRWHYNPFRNLVIKRYLWYVDKIIAVSNALRNAMHDNGINNISVIHNGIDVNSWQYTETQVLAFREKHNLLDKKIILFGGRLSEAKGGKQAVKSLAKVLEKVPSVILLVIGEQNEYAKEMRRIATDSYVDKNLVFTGWISGSELTACYGSADVILVPSMYPDPFPTVVLEGMACRKPVIAGCFGGSKEAIKDCITGYVVNPYNTKELSDKIIDLLSKEKKAEEFGRAGFNYVSTNFNLNDKITKHISIYIS